MADHRPRLTRLPAETAVRLRLVGPFAVSLNGRVLAPTAVGSRKARVLLALLAVERGRLVGVDRIVEALWQDNPPRLPAENVATLVSRLRTALGPDAMVGGRNGYRLASGVGVDLYDSEALVAASESRLADGNLTLALKHVREALSVLDGELLEDHPDTTWATDARGVHVELLRRARHTAAEAALAVGHLRSVRNVATEAATADPLDEVACRLLMRAYALGGETARALATYERLRTTLANELGVDPARATRDLHVAILQDRLTATPDRPDLGRSLCQRPVVEALVQLVAGLPVETVQEAVAAGSRRAFAAEA